MLPRGISTEVFGNNDLGFVTPSEFGGDIDSMIVRFLTVFESIDTIEAHPIPLTRVDFKILLPFLQALNVSNNIAVDAL